MRAKWTHLLAVLAAVALASPYRQAQPASPIAPPLSGQELIFATKEPPPFALKEQTALRAALGLRAES
jgi:hypothetical protein